MHFTRGLAADYLKSRYEEKNQAFDECRLRRHCINDHLRQGKKYPAVIKKQTHLEPNLGTIIFKLLSEIIQTDTHQQAVLRSSVKISDANQIGGSIIWIYE